MKAPPSVEILSTAPIDLNLRNPGVPDYSDVDNSEATSCMIHEVRTNRRCRALMNYRSTIMYYAARIIFLTPMMGVVLRPHGINRKETEVDNVA
jgi:hypothetical protein